jgi:hypothetical protein
MSFPDIPSNTAILPSTEEAGPTTAPSIFACTIVQSELEPLTPAALSTTAIIISPTSAFCPA